MTIYHQEISHHRYNYQNRILHGSGHSADDRTAGLPKLDKDFPSSAAVPAAMRVSGSLSVAAQQHGECDAFGALDLFFGADELNLGGIIDFGCGDQQLEKGAMNCISRRSIISSSIVDLSQLREEAFAMRTHGTSANRRRKMASDGTMTVETFCVRQKQINRKRRTNPRRHKSDPFFGCDALNSKSTEEGSFDLEKTDVRDENDRGDVEGMASNSSGNGSFASSMPPFSPSSAFESDGSHGNKVELGEEEEETEDESESSDEDEQLSEFAGDLLEQLSSSSPNALQKCNSGALLFFDPIPSLRALFDHYSSMGDIQMSATLCMIMGERVVESGLVSAAQAELWLLGYLELLERLRLWRVAALLVKCGAHLAEILHLAEQARVVNRANASTTTIAVFAKPASGAFGQRAMVVVTEVIWSISGNGSPNGKGARSRDVAICVHLTAGKEFGSKNNAKNIPDLR
uniref:Rav1p_C domain-containing protein n=1 Tax=Globodera pallida TaxID=36090 RepID=A0A183BQ38_GLOPA